MKIAVGTTSESKLAFLGEVLLELQLDAVVEPIDVKSNVSEQPLSISETKRGSINRAKRALKLSKDADLAIGIEIGYHPNVNGDYEMFCFASIAEPSGEIITAQSHKLKLPSFHQNILKGNKYLGDYVRLFLSENPDPVSQHVGIIIKDRKPFIQTAVKSVLIYFLQK